MSNMSQRPIYGMLLRSNSAYLVSNGNGGWDPTHVPADTQHLGAHAPSYGSTSMKSPVQLISAQICPVTGQPHEEKSRPGAIGLMIGICFCPIGCIAVIFDQKRTCPNCNYVIEEAWGGC
ncbi:hypothetical protein CcaverHIS002_0108560 [Cutaneotrichosporon cavernicola]|nr:hypothetical protein CcaverHIS002_0108560 [Cutaneotrichosporon cavernicola]